MNRMQVMFLALVMMFPAFLQAQGADQDQEGRTWGNYRVHQSFEFGGRITDTTGNDQMYATLVNLRSGPRLLSQDLTMDSTSHQGVLFDRLYLSSFGFGGDPEDVARLRIEKYKWYNFTGLYRRDQNVFDYNLFANPLNLNGTGISPLVGTATCGAGCVNAVNPQAFPWFNNSPHLQNTTRNMGDFSLTLLPQSTFSFRLGYARNNTNGTVDNTLENPLRTILTQDTQWRSDRYQFGVDVKILPRTTISGDAFFEHDKNDIGWLDNNLLFLLGNSTGPRIDPGILLPPLAGGTNCAGAGTPSIGPGGVFIINSGCNGILLATGPGGAYFRRGNVRTDIPTGQVSLISNYFRKLDITAAGSYSSATSDFLNFTEFSQGGGQAPSFNPTNSFTFLTTGAPRAQRISSSADLGLTYHITKSWSVSDKFRWYDWRQSGAINTGQFNCFLPAGTALASATGFPAGPITLIPFQAPCNSTLLGLTGLTTSGVVPAGRNYELLSLDSTVIGERSYFNTFRINWQPSRRFGAYVGYRYGRRELKNALPFSQAITFVTDGTATVPTTPTIGTPATESVDVDKINQHMGLIGMVVRPVDSWRINADVELLNSDNAFTNISPRHQQRVRTYTTFKVKPWATINGGVHFVETRNDFAPTTTVTGTDTPLFPTNVTLQPYGHKDHWRWYTAGVTLTPNSKFTFDFGWTLLDQQINSDTCMPVSGTGVFTGIVTAPAACANGSTARDLVLSYQEETNTVFVNTSYQLVKRVTLLLGYEGTADNGSISWLRADNGRQLLVVGDVFGNSPPLAGSNPTNLPCPLPFPTVSAGPPPTCAFPGPFAPQPLGPQAMNWHKASAGLNVVLTKNIMFKGLWSYYDYNAKDTSPLLSLLTTVASRDFHAHVGTVSLRYSF